MKKFNMWKVGEYKSQVVEAKYAYDAIKKAYPKHEICHWFGSTLYGGVAYYILTNGKEQFEVHISEEWRKK